MPANDRTIDRFETAHGVCTIIALDDHDVEAAYAKLPAQERAYADSLGPLRRREMICGRTALHDALASLEPDLATSPILSDDRGAPVLPAGWVGSVSHKGERGAALVAPVSAARVGVDLELAQPSRQDIARYILTRREQELLHDRGKGATLRFSIKEAIYKAIDPFVRRYVGFTEVELDVSDEGIALVTSRLPFAIETTWQERAGFWLTTARARAH
ncbi:MAG: 4'-phosphopantetheinyl transferase [Kofleriaceae bacterium]